MGRNIKELVLKSLDKGTALSAHQLSVNLAVSRQYIHRVLAELTSSSDVIKIGSPPKVTYQIDQTGDISSRGSMIWISGLPGSGKALMAKAASAHLRSFGIPVVTFDDETVQDGINGDLAISEKNDSEAVRRISEVAKTVIDSGITVIIAITANKNTDRNRARSLIGGFSFTEIYLTGDNKHKNQHRFDPPISPEITVGNNQSQEESSNLILNFLSSKFNLSH